MSREEKPQILIIEDDEELQETLTLLLKSSYDVVCAKDGVSGFKMALRSPPDLILLDIRMPHMDGFQTCQLIRADQEFDEVPIIILSGYGGEDERARALEFAADDFLSKPFSSTELLARIKRRLQVAKKDREAKSVGILKYGDLELDVTLARVLIAGCEVHFSQKEFRLLMLLVQQAGQLVSREEILDKVWSQQAGSNRVIDPHIVSIREKIAPSQAAISSIYGKGYVLKMNE